MLVTRRVITFPLLVAHLITLMTRCVTTDESVLLMLMTRVVHTFFLFLG